MELCRAVKPAKRPLMVIYLQSGFVFLFEHSLKSMTVPKHFPQQVLYGYHKSCWYFMASIRAATVKHYRSMIMKGI